MFFSGFFCGVSLQFGSNSFYPKFLTETRPRKPARRRSLPLATQQKSFLCISDFERARFFLLKGKENFFAGFCSLRAERRAWPLFFARTPRNSPPHTPFRRVLAGTDGNFGGDYLIPTSFSSFLIISIIAFKFKLSISFLLSTK